MPSPMPALVLESRLSSALDWRAWRLIPGWETKARRIAWAEAVGFELLVRTLIAMVPCRVHVLVYGDNDGVVEGWWNGRSRNEEVNTVFRRVHSISAAAQVAFHSPLRPNRCQSSRQGLPGENTVQPRSSFRQYPSLPSFPPSSSTSTRHLPFYLPFPFPAVPENSAPSTATIMTRGSRTIPYSTEAVFAETEMLAGDRLYKWTPSSSRAELHKSSSIPTADLLHINTILSHGWAEGTLETYGSGCSYPLLFSSRRLQLPWQVSTLARPSKNYVAGVRAWHILHGVSWALNKAEVDTLIRAAIALQPPSASKKKRQPYTGRNHRPPFFQSSTCAFPLMPPSPPVSLSPSIPALV
ncbi:hypothetical protein R3P38DRAFT_3629166 [Favolaschia claudopus]|uniref:Uncharacterized protein n=1 Tax=Favolaschia claudopus TaxID=2862362 RepID=A0AAV9ZY75_9AGAR